MAIALDPGRTPVRTAGLRRAAGAAVLVAGARVYMDAAAVQVGDVCPFRAITGLPCPLCGSTRALAEVSHLDPGFLRLNPVVALVVLLALLGGLAAAVRPGWGARWARSWPARHPVVALAAIGAVAWVVTLANRAAITGS